MPNSIARSPDFCLLEITFQTYSLTLLVEPGKIINTLSLIHTAPITAPRSEEKPNSVPRTQTEPHLREWQSGPSLRSETVCAWTEGESISLDSSRGHTFCIDPPAWELRVSLFSKCPFSLAKTAPAPAPGQACTVRAFHALHSLASLTGSNISTGAVPFWRRTRVLAGSPLCSWELQFNLTRASL